MQTEEAKAKQEQLKNGNEQESNAADERMAFFQKQIDELKAANERLLLEKSAAEAKASEEALEQEKKKLAENLDLRKRFKEEPRLDDPDKTLTQRELLDVVAEALETANAAQQKSIELMLRDELKKSHTDIDSVKKVVSQLIVKRDIDETRSKFEDFDELQPIIQDLWPKHPTMTAEEVYILAKGKVAGGVAPASKTETERPTSHITRSDERKDVVARAKEAIDRKRASDEAKEEDQYPEGSRQSARSIINAGIDRVLARRRET